MSSTAIVDIADGAATEIPMLPENLSSAARAGKRVFEARCVECHGQNTAGI
ncbi:hypothetical protein [Aliisedimentitalea sp. MJ-SS2]|uniref:hypothetical protein n=1 Tax=Aliisedimentitalea sp. MJ-SS2 TaxID=3049795 RepID=UPI00292F5753|nr:hypothetical protein [Alisedimentitalea sp. MJ-SS2]